ncbi:unnamed protein product [Amoebophrya sp. A120]|nr:unnamed protein product [Amoebophrya sp. A120]|eukprot:GSA120T00005938001.1
MSSTTSKRQTKKQSMRDKKKMMKAKDRRVLAASLEEHGILKIAATTTIDCGGSDDNISTTRQDDISARTVNYDENNRTSMVRLPSSDTAATLSDLIEALPKTQPAFDYYDCAIPVPNIECRRKAFDLQKYNPEHVVDIKNTIFSATSLFSFDAAEFPFADLVSDVFEKHVSSWGPDRREIVEEYYDLQEEANRRTTKRTSSSNGITSAAEEKISMNEDGAAVISRPTTSPIGRENNCKRATSCLQAAEDLAVTRSSSCSSSSSSSPTLSGPRVHHEGPHHRGAVAPAGESSSCGLFSVKQEERDRGAAAAPTQGYETSITGNKSFTSASEQQQHGVLPSAVNRRTSVHCYNRRAESNRNDRSGCCEKSFYSSGTTTTSASITPEGRRDQSCSSATSSKTASRPQDDGVEDYFHHTAGATSLLPGQVLGSTSPVSLILSGNDQQAQEQKHLVHAAVESSTPIKNSNSDSSTEVCSAKTTTGGQVSSRSEVSTPWSTGSSPVSEDRSCGACPRTAALQSTSTESSCINRSSSSRSRGEGPLLTGSLVLDDLADDVEMRGSSCSTIVARTGAGDQDHDHREEDLHRIDLDQRRQTFAESMQQRPDFQLSLIHLTAQGKNMAKFPPRSGHDPFRRGWMYALKEPTFRKRIDALFEKFMREVIKPRLKEQYREYLLDCLAQNRKPECGSWERGGRGTRNEEAMMVQLEGDHDSSCAPETAPVISAAARERSTTAASEQQEQMIAQLLEDFKVFYQYEPSLRAHVKDVKPLGIPHTDADYYHQPGEINFWWPVSHRVFASNSLFAESQPGRKDFAPFCCGYGEVVQFYGNQNLHFTKLNETEFSRVSLDLRVVPSFLYCDTWKKADGKVSFSNGGYYRMM